MEINNINNPYLHVMPSSTYADYGNYRASGSMESICETLHRCGRKVEDATRKVEEYADNFWNHIRVSPSLTEAAMARISQGTKLLADGGMERAFRHAFGDFPGEKFHKGFACYMSTSSGPMIGTLYVTSKRVAFCSEYPLSHKTYQKTYQAVHLKVVVAMEQVRSANPSSNVVNPREKYIQIVTVDGYEFWFMGFMSYDKALKLLCDVLRRSRAEADGVPVTAM